MAWVKIDDQFHDHPKVLEVGPLAEALYIRGLAYAARYLTDGYIPAAHLRRMGDLDAMEEAGKLVEAGLWDPCEKGYQIHDYLDYQPSAEKVNADREAARIRMEKARSGKQPAKPEPRSNEVPANNERSSHNPVPSRPTPNQEVPDGTSERAREPATEKPKRKHKLPDEFTVTDEMREWVAAKTDIPPSEVDPETDKFRDHFTASGETKLDWIAAWRNWIRRSPDFKPRASPRASPSRNGTPDWREKYRRHPDNTNVIDVEVRN